MTHEQTSALQPLFEVEVPDSLFMKFADAGFNNGARQIQKWDSAYNFEGATKYLASTPEREAAPELLEALERLLAENPAFRSKPIGGENSQARYGQKMAIEAEDFARAVIAKVRRQQ